MWKEKKKKKKKKRLAFPTSRDIKTRLKLGHKRKGISREIAKTKLRLLVRIFREKYVDTNSFSPPSFLFLFLNAFVARCLSLQRIASKNLTFYNSRELFIPRWAGRLCDKGKPSSKTCACCSATRKSAPTGNGTRKKKRNARCRSSILFFAAVFRGREFSEDIPRGHVVDATVSCSRLIN